MWFCQILNNLVLSSIILDCSSSLDVFVLLSKALVPANVESNLYQYHLLQLQKEKYVEKVTDGYTLTDRGLAYADKHSTSLKKTRSQPKVITTIFVTNQAGEILLVPKKRQPFMGVMNLPSGKIHLNETIEEAAQREIQEKVANYLSPHTLQLEHIGIAHMTIKQNGYTISDYISLLLHTSVSNETIIENGAFYADSEITNIQLVPSVFELIQAFKSKNLFTESVIQTWEFKEHS